MTLAARLNHHLDALPRPTIRVAGRAGPSFQILGYTGLAVAIVLTQVLAATTGRITWCSRAIAVAQPDDLDRRVGPFTGHRFPSRAARHR
jgi:hypothetical protein